MGLILAEQTLLIALDDEKGRDTTHWGSDAGLAGALLLDIAHLGRVTTRAGGKIVALDGAPPGHELLHDVYTTIASSSKDRDAKGWVERFRAMSSRCASESLAGSCSAAFSPRSTRRCSGS